MAPPKKPPGTGDGNDSDPPRNGDDGNGGDDTPDKVGDVDAGNGVGSAQGAIARYADAGTPGEGTGTSKPKDGDDPGDPNDGQDPYDSLTPEEQRAAIDEIISDSNPNFPMSEGTAEAILRSGPPGTRPVVGGPSAEGADVRFVDSEGNEVARTENKSLDGGPNSFNRNLAHAAGQVGYDGTVAVQVKDGTDVNELMHKFTGNRTDEKLTKYENVDVVFYDENGNVVGTYNAGTRP